MYKCLQLKYLGAVLAVLAVIVTFFIVKLMLASGSQIEVIVSACNDEKTIKEIKNMLLPYPNTKLVVYEKCGNNTYDNIPLINVGREQHTFAHHISTNYDTLSDKIVCTAGNFDKHSRRRAFLSYALKNNDLDFKCNTEPGEPVKLDSLQNFTIATYDGVKQTSAEPTGLANWSKLHIGTFDPLKQACFEGMFQTSAKAVHRRPQSDYQNIVTQLSSKNPEAGHYMERLQAMVYDL